MTNTANYQPREGSVPARLIAHMKERGESCSRNAIANLLNIDRKNVINNLAAAVAHGMLVRDGDIYSLPRGTATRAAADLQNAWGVGAKPAFPAAPPRAGDPPPKPPRKTAKSPGHALATVPARGAPSPITAVAHIEPIDLQPASLRQVGGTHYKQMAVQPWDVVDGWPLELRIGYYRGNALKYLMRMGSKDHELQEVQKCQHYVAKLIEVLRERDGQVAAA